MARGSWGAHSITAPSLAQCLLECLQLAGRVDQALAQRPGTSLAHIVVAHHKLLEVPLGPEHRGQGLATGGRQVAVLQPGGGTWPG